MTNIFATEFLDKTFPELAELSEGDRDQLADIIAGRTKCEGLPWVYFVRGDIPLGNLVAYNQLPIRGRGLDAVVAATGSLEDFTEYITKTQRECARSYVFNILDPIDVLKAVASDYAKMKIRAEEAEAKLAKIEEILDIDPWGG